MSKFHKDRISKELYYLNIAQNVATRGTCLKRNYGAVIVNNDVIVSSGYTGSPRGCEHCFECIRAAHGLDTGDRGFERCRSVHAEMNAIISANRADMIGATMFLVGVDPDNSVYFNSTTNLSGSPCNICKKMIINSGIEKVITLKTDNSTVTTHTTLVSEYQQDINEMN